MYRTIKWSEKCDVLLSLQMWRISFFIKKIKTKQHKTEQKTKKMSQNNRLTKLENAKKVKVNHTVTDKNNQVCIV